MTAFDLPLLFSVLLQACTAHGMLSLHHWSRATISTGGKVASAEDADSMSPLSGIGDYQKPRVLAVDWHCLYWLLVGADSLMEVDCSSYNNWIWPPA